MNQNFQKLLQQYNYEFPEELIAQEPSSPRDAARLLAYDLESDKTQFDVFKNIGRYIPKNAVIVFNETKVVPARLAMQKETGGKAEIFYISHDKNFVKVIADRKLKVGQKLYFFSGIILSPTKDPFFSPSLFRQQGILRRLTPQNGAKKEKKIYFTIIKQEENFYFLKPSFPISRILKIISVYGKTPLPPYIKHSKLSEKQRREKYQTVFAKAGVSVAAPTASLHFTKNLIHQLQRERREVVYVNLNVGLGTFAPLKEEHVKNNSLHSEWYEIPKDTATIIRKAKKEKRPIFAIGTTVVRTLESSNNLRKLKGDTTLFIREGYKFKIVNGLVTNFHVPKSSLLMLVSALVGRKKLLELYKNAINKKMKLFSFGDGMVIQ
jgi:S-adenosylmethionine:tRNA ribosyltransferase-isomerase